MSLNRTNRKFEEMCAAAQVDLGENQEPSDQAKEAFRLKLRFDLVKMCDVVTCCLFITYSYTV